MPDKGYLIRIVACVGTVLAPEPGIQTPKDRQYLASYDPEAYNGRGAATWTAEKSEALVFASFREAAACYQAVPANRPTRPDGQPNRPLTSFTVEIALEELV